MAEDRSVAAGLLMVRHLAHIDGAVAFEVFGNAVRAALELVSRDGFETDLETKILAWVEFLLSTGERKGPKSRLIP